MIFSSVTSSSESNGNANKMKDIHLYEEVGPALPPQGSTNVDTNRPMTSNVIYNTAEYEEGSCSNFCQVPQVKKYLDVAEYKTWITSNLLSLYSL